MDREIGNHRHTQEVLRAITEGTASVTGDAFFRLLVRHLAAAFEVRYAMVTECTDATKTRLRTLAFIEHDRFLENIEYDVAGTPCERVVDGEVCYYPERLSYYFPETVVQESYLGVAIQDSTGHTLGHLAVLDDRPMHRSPYDMTILQIFAARAGAELERQRTERALRESEQRYRSLYTKTPVMLHSTDPHGKIISVSDYWLQMLGYEHDEVIGRQNTEFLTEASRHYAQKVGIPAFLANGYIKDIEYEFVKKHGEVLHVLLSAVTEKNDDGEVTRTLAVLIDITERKQAENALRKNEQQLRQLNEQLEDHSRNLEQKVAERTHEIERRRQVAEHLRDVLTILNSNRSLDEILDYIVAEATCLMDTDSGAIFRLQDDQTMLTIQASRGLPTDYADGLNFPVARSFLGQAIVKRQPVIIADLSSAIWGDDIELSTPRRELLARYRTLLTVPLIRQGAADHSEAIHGGIALYYTESHVFTAEEIDLAVAFADQATLAIENAQLRQRVRQSAVMEERGRLARELHDSVTQSLYSLTLLAEGWRRLAKSGRLDDFDAPLSELGGIAQQALKEMRLLVHQLRPPALEKAGLAGALHERLAAVERRAGVEARLLADDVEDLPAVAQEGLYRIAQEALNNALKHAAATSVEVRIYADATRLSLEIADNGQGFDVGIMSANGGIGLASMRERAEYMGGSLQIRSAPGDGTSVTVQIPRPGLAHHQEM